jgi:hypothetical protein
MHTVTRITTSGDQIALLISVSPFGPAHARKALIQQYTMLANNCTHLVREESFADETKAAKAFDQLAATYGDTTP